MCYSLSLSGDNQQTWNRTQRPLIENVINFFNDREMVNEGVNITIDWDSQNNRWYHIVFEVQWTAKIGSSMITLQMKKEKHLVLS